VDRENQILTLPDGRQLGFAEYGDGTPLLYFHGHPCSRLEARYLAGREGVRVIGIDRPGMGLSSYQPRRTLISWADDVVSLADSLGIEKFSVAGLSGGAPYALACAYAIPQRINACGIVSGVWTIDRKTTFLAAWMPWVMLPIMGRFLKDVDTAKGLLTKQAVKAWPTADKRILDDPTVPDIMATALVEAFRQGPKGPACDAMLIGRIKGFRLDQIVHPNIHLWHGCADQQVSIAVARKVAQSLTGCTATFYDDEGHLSVIVNHRDEILASLCAGDFLPG